MVNTKKQLDELFLISILISKGVSAMRVLETLTYADQIAAIINPEATRGKMLPKTAEEVEQSLRAGLGVAIIEDGIVISYAAVYEWKYYLEIGSVVTREDYRGKGYATRVVQSAITASKKHSSAKPIIALTNSASTPIFEKQGFVLCPKNEGNEELWEPCKDACVEYGRWPVCHCHFMILGGTF